MRIVLTTMVGLALLAAACEGPSRGQTASAGTSAGPVPTTGGATTSGGGTGGSATTAGGQSSGGTSGGDLAAGEPCSSDSACASGNCGVDGAGHCCLSPDRCPLGDGGQSCGPTDCDVTGACAYPDAGTTCGPSSCFNGLFIPPGRCDGLGGCVPGAAALCPDRYGCNDAGACNTSCGSSADCAIAYVCNAHHCGSQRSAGSCTEGDDCVSNECSGLDAGDDGGIGGLCCSQLCPEPNPVCRSVRCDEATGDCRYPVDLVCATPTCYKDKSITNACDEYGSCIPTFTQCPNNLACNSTHTACDTSCRKDADCASGKSCDLDAGTCGP